MMHGDRRRFFAHAASSALLGALLLCSLVLSGCGNSPPKAIRSAPPPLPGRWVADVSRTRQAAEELAGEAIREPWLEELSPNSCWLDLGADGRFVFQLGGEPIPVTIKGTWVETTGGLEITPTWVNAQKVAPGESKTDIVRRDGFHLIVSQGKYGLYLGPAPE